MLPIKRQQQILTWLEQEGTLRVSEISERLGVSEMTVYQDIKPLIDEHKVSKTSKGITLVAQTPNLLNRCVYCLKEPNSRMSVQLIKKTNKLSKLVVPIVLYCDIKISSRTSPK